MAKIILYGVGSIQLRREIEFFLDDSHEIIGYSDTYYKSDILDEKPFILPQNLQQQDFDYIILLSYKSSILKKMEQDLLLLGVPKDKIIEPTIFLQNDAERCQLDVVSDIQEFVKDQEGLIFGLSYSRRGIQLSQLSHAFYDCSWAGLDIYYNFKLFQYLYRHKSLSTVKMALLIFPYYYFDYDMSKSEQQYKNGQIFSIFRLNDFHNYWFLPNGNSYVKNYQLFGTKLSNFYRTHRYELQNNSVYQGNDKEATLDNIWFRNNPDTVYENIILFTEFLQDIIINKIEPIIIIPPFYLNGIDCHSYKAFLKKKKQFYSIIQNTMKNTGDFRIFDYSDVYADNRKFFMDLTHLNSNGARDFTKQIDYELFK